MFAKIDPDTGLISSMTERSLWGAKGKGPEFGVKIIDTVTQPEIPATT